jgi:DNA end-binding protein Ku
MAKRASWRGQLTLSLVTCEVEFYRAVTQTNDIHFNLINPETGNRVSMKTVDEETGEELERGELVKGFEFKKGRYAVVTDEEIKALKLDSSDAIELEKFVPIKDIDPRYFEDTWYVVPKDKRDEETFAVIREAMKREGRAGLTRIVMSRKERAILLIPQDKGMIAYSVHEVEDLISLDDVMPQKIDTPAPEMVKIALQLIEQKTGDFDVSDFTDRYGARLRELLDAKLKGEDLPPIEVPKTNVIDLMSALKESVKRKEGPAKKKATKAKAARHHSTARKRA